MSNTRPPDFIDYPRLESIAPDEFRSRKPYPWANPQGVLTPEGFLRLQQNLPELSRFEKHIGVQRGARQAPHDRYTLEYTSQCQLPGVWSAFIRELAAPRYRETLCRLMGVRRLEMNFHWHFTPAGASVSPHCDSRRKLGSHIFYFNSNDDWDPSWGGETVVLDDGGRFRARSAPRFEDFEAAFPAKTMHNRSFIFSRTARSWHGVREICCPDDALRKVFIVVLNRADPIAKLRAKLSGKKFERV